MRNIKTSISLIIFLLLACIIIADDPDNTQFSKDGKAMFKINTVGPVIISSDGLTSKLTFKFNRIDVDRWEVEYCFKDYDKDFVVKDKDTKDIYADIPVSIISGKPVASLTLNMEKNCDKFLLGGILGDTIKIGEQSTIITISEQNVTFAITPEHQTCNYLSCLSHIILENNNDFNITINSSDLSASVEGTTDTYITFEYSSTENITIDNYVCPEETNCTLSGSHTELLSQTRTANINEGLDVTILPGESLSFDLHAKMVDINSEFKYNVSIMYQEIEYKIDPYFTTTNSSFNDGTYTYTFLNDSGFVQKNDTVLAGSYLSEVFDALGESVWDNISWIQDVCYFCEFPDNLGTDSGDYIRTVDMTNNTILMHMNEVSGGVIYDTSGQGNNASYNGALYSSTGVLNTSIGFDGINDFVNFGDTYDIVGPITWELWIIRNGIGVGGRHPFIDKWYDGSSAAYSFALSSYTNLNIWFRNSSQSTFIGDFAVNTYSTKFTHVVITYDGSDIRVYDNGQYVDLLHINGPPASNNAGFTLGKYTHPAAGWFKGWIDEFAVYNRTLSDQEVMDHYKRGLPKFNVSVRSCDDSVCSGESFSEITNISPQDLSVIDNRYFQYNFGFNNTAQQLYNVTIGYTSNALILSNLDYENTLGLNLYNIFTWDTNALANSTLRVNNTALGIDNTNYSSVNVTEHSLTSIIFNQTGTYDFYVESCIVGECVNSSGSFIVVDLGINYNILYTNLMRGYTIDSNLYANEVRLNYTEGGVKISGDTIECSLLYPNTTLIKKENLSEVFIAPSVISTLTGTVDSGNLASIITEYDDDSYNISEVGGAPGFEVRINFTGVTNGFSRLTIREWYEGNIAHVVNLQLYNYTSASWVTQFQLTDDSEWDIHTQDYSDSSDYISGGIVQVNIIHVSSGNPIHNFYLDYIALGTGDYNRSDFYTFTQTDPEGVYSLSCTNLNNSFTHHQNFNLYTSGTCDIDPLSRELNTYVDYTFNQTYIDVNSILVYNETIITTMANDGSYTYIYNNTNNSYSCEFNYTVDTITLSTDYSLYNYNESAQLTFSQPNVVVKVFQGEDLDDTIFLPSSPGTIQIDSLNSGPHVWRVYNLSNDLSQYYYNNVSVTVTSTTVQTISYDNSYAFESSSDLCLDSILVRNERNDTDLAFTYIMGGYGTNGTCLIDVSAQSLGTYNFTVASTPNDGLNDGNNITYSYSITSGTSATILELRIGGMNDEGQSLVRDDVTIFIKVSDAESDPVDILSLWIWHYKFTPVMNFTPYNLTLTTSPSGVWHNFTFNSTYELGHGVFPATQLEVNITGGSKKRTTGFLVDNTYTPENFWTYVARYIHGEII